MSFGAQAHAGKSTRLHRIDLRVLDFNQRAISSYAKVGFSEEGVERETCLVNGSWHGDLIMRILESEYRARYGVEGEANRGSESASSMVLVHRHCDNEDDGTAEIVALS